MSSTVCGVSPDVQWSMSVWLPSLERQYSSSAAPGSSSVPVRLRLLTVISFVLVLVKV